MAIRKEIYKNKPHRLVLVRFQRATTGNPDPDRPDIDDRGYTGSDHGPIVGAIEGNNIIVRLVRENIENAARLFVKSSNTSVVTILSPAGGSLSNTRQMEIQLQGVAGAGSNPSTAKIEVRFNSLTGPVIYELSVWAFRALSVRITPHMVTIAQSGSAAPGIGSGVNINNIIDLVRAVWRPCGITFTVGATANENVSYATAGVVSWSGSGATSEVNQLLQTNHVPNSINVYFVNQIGLPTSPGVLGLGISRTSMATFGLARPGIILGDRNASGSIRTADTMWLANDLAHEIGHFFGLWHPEQKQAPNEREDTWSRRMLMHNFNLMGQLNNWKDDVGYGNLRRGCLITMKNLTQLTTDGECTTSRATINSAAGPY